MKRTILAVVTLLAVTGSKSEAPPPGGASASKGSTLVINGAGATVPNPIDSKWLQRIAL